MRYCDFIRVEGKRAVYCEACNRWATTDAQRECAPQRTRALIFAEAVERWLAAGRPERTDAEVDGILETFCSPCEYFKDGHCTHGLCGCNVMSSSDERSTLLGKLVSWAISPALLNKLRMGTEHCPIEKW